MSWLWGGGGGGSSTVDGVGRTIAFGKVQVKLLRQLAEGGYAVVFEGVDSRTRQQFAVKRIITADDETREQAEREVDVHERLAEAQHIVGYHGCARVPGRNGLEIYLLLEYCVHGHVWQWCSASPLGPRQRLTALAEIATGLAAMHALPLAHHDVKLENVLVREGGSCALCDFGSATAELTPAGPLDKRSRLLLQDRLERFSTPMYRAPEVVDLYAQLPCGTEADVWALGCILYVLCYGTHPFADASALQISQAKWAPPASQSGKQQLDGAGEAQGEASEPEPEPPPVPQLQERPQQQQQERSLAPRAAAQAARPPPAAAATPPKQQRGRQQLQHQPQELRRPVVPPKAAGWLLAANGSPAAGGRAQVVQQLAQEAARLDEWDRQLFLPRKLTPTTQPVAVHRTP